MIQAEGEHAVETAGEAKLVQLRLKSGFAVSLEPSKSALQVGPVRLAVAEPRATSEQIARGFVPVGPTVVLSAQSGPLEVSFVADGFHVRAGHRLVLAVERALPCQLPGGCRSWRLEPAQYRAGRCQAELPTPGLRLQFGSLPAVLSDSAAP